MKKIILTNDDFSSIEDIGEKFNVKNVFYNDYDKKIYI